MRRFSSCLSYSVIKNVPRQGRGTTAGTGPKAREQRFCSDSLGRQLCQASLLLPFDPVTSQVKLTRSQQMEGSACPLSLSGPQEPHSLRSSALSLTAARPLVKYSLKKSPSQPDFTASFAGIFSLPSLAAIKNNQFQRT